MARVILPPLSYFSIFLEVLERRGGLFLNDCNDADVTHIFKGKGKLNRIKKLPYHTCYIFCFSLKLSSFLQNLSLRNERFYLLPVLHEKCPNSVRIYRNIWTRNNSIFGHFSCSEKKNREKNPVKTNSIIVKNGGNEQMAYYARNF